MATAVPVIHGAPTSRKGQGMTRQDTTKGKKVRRLQPHRSLSHSCSSGP